MKGIIKIALQRNARNVMVVARLVFQLEIQKDVLLAKTICILPEVKHFNYFYYLSASGTCSSDCPEGTYS